MEWIECSKQMPSAYEDVLVYAVDFPRFIILQAAWLPRWKKWEFCKGQIKSLDYDNITHWMPLPGAPNTQQNGQV